MSAGNGDNSDADPTLRLEAEAGTGSNSDTGSWDLTPPPIDALPRSASLSGDLTPRPSGSGGSGGPGDSGARARRLPVIEGYDILDVLGHGGMGVVYRARQRKLNRIVALKMVLASEHASPKTLRRLMLEAEAAASLGHPNIVQIFELGQHDGQPYFTMEFVEGAPLSASHPRAPKNCEEIAGLFAKIADAVHAAHQRGIIHRDLKPPNVLLTAAGEPKITDFGLAKRLDAEPDLTAPGAVLGTPAYMAPEQAAGRADQIGPPTDVHAIGVMLYQMLAGEPPFRGENEHDTLSRVLTKEAAWPVKAPRAVPRDLRTICLKCLQKSPEARYATAQELADDLRRFRMGDPIRARPIGPVVRAARWVRRRRVQSLAAVLAVVVAVVAASATYQYLAYARPTAALYADFDTRWGAPSALFEPISEAAFARRPLTYRVTRAGWYGRVRKVEAVNPAGELVADPGMLPPVLGLGFESALSTAVLQYRYRDDGKVSEERGLDRAGKLTWRCVYTVRDAADGETRGRAEVARFITATGVDQEARRGTTMLRITRDGQGRDIEVRYVESRGDQRTSGAAFGRRFTYGDGPRPVSDMYLDVHGRPAVAAGGAGYAERRLAYDEFGRAIDVRYFDAAENPMRERFGVHRQLLTYDDDGNLAHIRLVGPDGEPLPHMYGYTEVDLMRGEGGRIVADEYRGFDEARHGFAAVRTTRGPKEEVVSVTHVDAAGTPVERLRVVVTGTSPQERARAGSLRFNDVLLAMDEAPVRSVFAFEPRDFTRPARLLALRKGEEVELSWPPLGASFQDVAESRLPVAAR